jgi:hypothetical protein
MSFLIYLDQFNVRNVYLEQVTAHSHQPHDVQMSRLIYSTKCITLNNIGFAMHFVPTKVIQHYNDDWSIYFDASHPVNAGIIEQFRKVESDIINKFMHPGLADKQQCTFTNTLMEGCIKTDNETNASLISRSSSSADVQFILYIIGIWENQTEFGLACKFAKW